VFKNFQIGHLAFVFFVISFHCWFLFDAWLASKKFENLMLVVPLATVACVVGGIILVGAIRSSNLSSMENKLASIDSRIPFLMLLLCAYFFCLLFLTFDIATFLFLVTSLIILGERRTWIIVVYSLITTIVSVFGLKFMISVPVPTIFG
tara:strand:- start:363 stop:809 length:447 start_codon:yes stop_codon:yes gene_type:complete